MERIFTVLLTGDSLDVIDSALAAVKGKLADEAAFVRQIVADQRQASLAIDPGIDADRRRMRSAPAAHAADSTAQHTGSDDRQSATSTTRKATRQSATSTTRKGTRRAGQVTPVPLDGPPPPAPASRPVDVDQLDMLAL